MIPVLYHPHSGSWDTALPIYILNHAATCTHVTGLDFARMLSGGTGVFVLNGQHCATDKDYLAINEAAKNFNRAVFLIIGDEEALFRVDRLDHPRKRTWWFCPPFAPKQEVDRVAPFGWPLDAPEMIEQARKQNYGARRYEWSFMGQVTHQRRQQCVHHAKLLVTMPSKRVLLTTDAFAKGEPREKYYDVMTRSKLVLCPSGPCTPDSFRFAESLEAGCVPVVDMLPPRFGYTYGYWEYLFPRQLLPFPIASDWAKLPGIVDGALMNWTQLSLECKFWWEQQKERWIREMKEDLNG